MYLQLPYSSYFPLVGGCLRWPDGIRVALGAVRRWAISSYPIQNDLVQTVSPCPRNDDVFPGCAGRYPERIRLFLGACHRSIIRIQPTLVPGNMKGGDSNVDRLHVLVAILL